MTTSSPGAQPFWSVEPVPPRRAQQAPQDPRRTVRPGGLLVALAVVGAGVVLLVAAGQHRRYHNQRIAACCNNLKQLWTMQMNYMCHVGGNRQGGWLMPRATGADFWLNLTRTTPPLIDQSIGDIFDCPVSPEIGSAVNCEYRGPASDVNDYANGDPVGACDHGDDGIVVLRKSGDVMLYKRDDAVAIAALVRTRR